MSIKSPTNKQMKRIALDHLEHAAGKMEEHAVRTGGAPLTIELSKAMTAGAFREYKSKRYRFEGPGAFVDPLIFTVMPSPVGQETYQYSKINTNVSQQCRKCLPGCSLQERVNAYFQ